MGGPLLPALDTFILTIPFVGFLATWMLRLDERFANHGGGPRPNRSFCQVDGEGRRFLSDPDGKPWKKYPRRQIEARIIHNQVPDAAESLLEDARPGTRRAASI